MDLEIQARIKAVAEKYPTDALVVVIGAAQAETAAIAAETVTIGDPSMAGPLAEVQLGLAVYHILELKNQLDQTVWDGQISMMEMVLDVEDIVSEVQACRGLCVLDETEDS